MQCVLSFHRKGTGLCVFFSYKAKIANVVSFSSVYAFGPEFKSSSVKSRFRAGNRQIITYDYQMHQFHWFRVAICNLPLQEKTSGYLAVEHRQNVVHTTELFQVFSLSQAYPGCVWTGHIMSCVRSKMTEETRAHTDLVECVSFPALMCEVHCTPAHWLALHSYTLE